MEVRAIMSQNETLVLAQVVAAMRRIARKPWPQEHQRVREFYLREGGGLQRVRVSIRDTQKCNPLWMPDWAKAESNPCDCPKCIAIRVLRELDTFAEEQRAAQAS
jgi:hypothetical protein